MKREMNEVEKFTSLFVDFVDQYDYDFSTPKFLIQPFPILADCVGRNEDGKIELIDTQDKYEKYAEKIFRQVKWVMEKNDDLYSRLSHIMIMIIHKPFRLPFLIYIKDEIDNETFSKLLIENWIVTEFPNQNGIPMMLELFKKADKNYLMDEDDRKEYDKLPEKVKIYRGIQKGAREDGLSWTTNKEVAEWFAKRFNHNGKIIEGWINKKDIFAYIGERNESEVIVDPYKIEGIFK